MGKITIVGLGPGPEAWLTGQAKAALLSAPVYVQTTRHGCLEAGQTAGSMDDLYESAAAYDELNEAIADRLITAAAAGDVVYAVPGHGVKGQTAVSVLMQKAAQAGVETAVCPGVSMEDAALAACGLDACTGCVSVSRTVDKEKLDLGLTLAVTDVDSRLIAGEVKVALMTRYADEQPVWFVTMGQTEVSARALMLCELDRLAEYPPFSVVVLPPVALTERTAFTAQDLMDICRILRAPNGCPWDREQTHMSIRQNMIEEACEASAAILLGDDDEMCEELGDVLLQLTLHAVMGEEESAYTWTDIATGICEKMIRRHPHIFGNEQADTAEQVLDTWERVKAAEPGRQNKTPFKGVGDGMPALMRAERLH
ncbi:MAG: hypothetical protein IJN00_04925, partial [Clostridia bacterium]|nr:hypothetical protein [Clostridia bacterium]